MRFYNALRQFYCGVDLHARSIYICIMNKDRKVLVHRQLKNRSTDLLLKILQPYKHDLVVGAESTFAWYWLADFCADNDIEFISLTLRLRWNQLTCALWVMDDYLASVKFA